MNRRNSTAEAEFFEYQAQEEPLDSQTAEAPMAYSVMTFGPDGLVAEMSLSNALPMRSTTSGMILLSPADLAETEDDVDDPVEAQAIRDAIKDIDSGNWTDWNILRNEP